jgi:hypothetical protein
VATTSCFRCSLKATRTGTGESFPVELPPRLTPQ